MSNVRRSSLAGLLLLLGSTPVGCYSGLDGKNSAGLDGADDGDGSGANSEGGDDGAVPADLEPAPVRLRTLLSRQYVNAVGDLLGEEAAAVASPPPDTAINGFDAVAASQLVLSSASVDTYERSAQAVAQAAMQADPGRVGSYYGCTPMGPGDEACLTEFVESFGHLAFRRPLIDEEIASYTAVGLAAAADLDDFDYGVQTAIATFLQSPHFLYQVEVGEPTETPGVRRLSGLEVATRMSLLLTDTIPDAELLAQAEAGALDTEEGVREAAEALLMRPQARAALAEFFSEVYRLRDLPATPKDPTVFPEFSPSLSAAMVQETLALIDDLAWEQDADFRELFDAPYTFVDAELAAHYGLPEPEQYGDELTRVTLPDEQRRGGLFGHAGLLSLLAHVTTTSPTHRGKFLRQQIYCLSIPAAPGEVDTTLPTNEEWKTMRQRLEAHMSDPNCKGCHMLMDPIGFGLENYDGIGRFRTTENGEPIDAESELDGQRFAGAAELGALVKAAPETSACLVRNLFRHGTGHIELEGEYDALDRIDAAFGESGYRMQDLLVELVASPAFRLVGDPS
ncbi:MAG: DUF1592 domain-containing protein [Myxococcota bacterium]